MNRREWCLSILAAGAAPLGTSRITTAATPGRQQGAAAVIVDAAVRHTPEERHDLFKGYLRRRAADVTRAHLQGIDSLETWTRERPRVARELRYMLGLDPWPTRTPLQARVTGHIDRPTHRVEKVVFQSLPGLYVTGNLYLPREARGALPTVLYLCGHEPGPDGAKVRFQHHGIWFARHGYAALIIDTLEFGELPGLHHGTHNLEMWDWLSLGFSPAGPEVWNAIRALDYLETRAEVDRSRIALTGISGGGAITWYTAAVDERVAVAVPVCASWTVEQQVALDTVDENCDCIFLHNTFQHDLATAGALIAPRPLTFLNAGRDAMFPAGGYRDVRRQLTPVYAWYDRPAHLVMYEHDAQHEDIVPFRKEASEWIGHWLKGDDTPFDEGTIVPEDAATLRVLDHYPADTINDSIHRTFISVHEPRAWTDRAAWERRRAGLIEQIRNQALRLFPDARGPFASWTRADLGWADRYCDVLNVEFTTEQEVRVQGRLFIPRDARARTSALIYVKRSDDLVYGVDWDPLLPLLGRHVVFALHPRGVDYPVNAYQLATIKRTAALLGGTLETMQLWDVLRAIDFLVEDRELPLTSVSLYGRGAMGGVVLYAAALDARVTRVIVDDLPASHWHGPPLLNVLRLTDLPELAGLLAPRDLVSLGPLPPAYAYTASLYELYGQRAAMRQAGGLGQAMQVGV